jgi:hypothetical protein
MFKTYNAFNADGYFLGNFDADEIISVQINGRKLYFKDVLKALYDYQKETSGTKDDGSKYQFPLQILVNNFCNGKLAFCKKDHPFSYFVEKNAENKFSV